MAAPQLQPTARVQVRGLSRAELNGTVGAVLPPDDDAEAQQLRDAGRVKVSHYPKPLALRPANLVPAPEPDFSTPPLPFTLLEIVRREAPVAELCAVAAGSGEGLGPIDRAGNVDASDELAEALWQIYGDDSPPQPLPPDLEAVVLNTPGHRLYWLSLGQIGHDVLIEACDGVWRGYQAFARSGDSGAGAAGDAAAAPTREGDRVQAFGGVLIEACEGRRPSGYRAKEWVSPEPVGAEPAAHELWGGGRDLPRGDVAEVLRLVSALREQAPAIAGRLRESSGQADDEAASCWAQQMLESAGFSVVPSRPGTPRQSAGYAEADAVWVFSDPGVSPQCELEIPTRLAFPFMRSYARLTGEFPSGTVFLKILEFVGCDDTDADLAWTFRVADMRRRRGC